MSVYCLHRQLFEAVYIVHDRVMGSFIKRSFISHQYFLYHVVVFLSYDTPLDRLFCEELRYPPRYVIV